LIHLIGIDPYPYIEVLGVRNQQNRLRRPSSSQQHATRRGAPAGFLATGGRLGGDAERWIGFVGENLGNHRFYPYFSELGLFGFNFVLNQSIET